MMNAPQIDTSCDQRTILVDGPVIPRVWISDNNKLWQSWIDFIQSMLGRHVPVSRASSETNATSSLRVSNLPRDCSLQPHTRQAQMSATIYRPPELRQLRASQTRAQRSSHMVRKWRPSQKSQNRIEFSNLSLKPKEPYQHMFTQSNHERWRKMTHTSPRDVITVKSRLSSPAPPSSNISTTSWLACICIKIKYD